MSEFGFEDDLQDLDRVTTLADRNMLSWTYFEWAANSAPAPPGALVGADGRLQTPALEIVRPYPSAVAGVPDGWSFNRATGLFTLDYTPSVRPRCCTIIFVPRLQYPNGYSVQLSGAQSLSRPAAPWLILRSLPGHRRVQLIVTPRA